MIITTTKIILYIILCKSFLNYSGYHPANYESYPRKFGFRRV